MDAEAEASGNTKVPKLKPHLKQWIYASVDSSCSSLKFAKPETGEVVSRILQYAEDKDKGAFTPSRERDKLTLALGNPEHTGCTRGLWKRTSWKHGFVEDKHMYKKHGRDRQSDLELQVKALVEKACGERTVYGGTDTNGAVGRTGDSWQPFRCSQQSRFHCNRNRRRSHTGTN
jgi:hypothetical protein